MLPLYFICTTTAKTQQHSMNETITLLQYILFTALCAALLIEMLHYLLLGIRLLRHNRKHKTAKTTASTPLPPVSIIICARNEAENIRNFLPLVLEQDYPEYQVIVVNDATPPTTPKKPSMIYKNSIRTYISPTYPNRQESFRTKSWQ